MKIAFNPSTVAALTTPPNNKDITFDLRGRNIFARGVKFYGTDTNTWRDIKINNVSIGSYTLDLRNGSNTTLSHKDGVVTINSTWRPVVDSLTSDSATSSLSANQGRVLAGLINSKSDSDHNHDDRYLKLTGGIMSGQISSNYSVGTWIAGCTNAILKATADGYNSLICAPIKSGNISISAWTAEDNLNFGYAKKGKTENSFDTRMYWDAPNNNLHAGAFTGHLYGTADNAVNSDTTDGVHLEWSGELGVNNYAWLAGWTNDGKKIKVVNKNQFATSGHNHDGRYVYNYGSTADVNGQALNQNALFMSTTSGISRDWWHILQAAWNSECRWNSQIAFPTQNRNGMYYRSGLGDNTKWGSWVKLLDVNNYSSTLDSRYYTETEVNSLLDAKLNRQNLSYGTWNPRGYNLAADYFYNGGDLSISESGGQIHVSVDGYFWQNEGRYRVLDTSDIGGIRGSVSIRQYLSNTDTNWYPLIWGGSSHNNTSDSTGAVYKSHDKLSWQTSSQTLYATRLQSESLNTGSAFFRPGGDSTLKIYSGRTNDNCNDGCVALQTSIDGTDGETHPYPTRYQRRCTIALQPRGGAVYIGTSPSGFNSGDKLYVAGQSYFTDIITTPVIRVIGTSDNMAWNRGSGRIVFVEDVSNSQAVSLVYTSYDSVRAPAGIRLTGNQGNEWFEASRLIKTGSNDNYVLLGAGGHILKGNANGNIPINNGTVNTNLNADLLDGYHASSFIKMKQFRFGQYKKGFWTKILTITINSTSDLQPVIAFNWIPSECAREVWAEFTINWRNNSPIFYAIWKGTAVRTLTCVNSSGNIWDVWVYGNKNSYDPYGEIQVTYAHNISSYNGGSLGYSDSDPGGIRCTLGGYVNYARSTGNADTVDGQHASAFSYKSWWHWYGKDGQPNLLWGGNNENDYYVYNPSNFRVAYASSAGNADTLDGEHASSFVRAGHYKSQDLNKLDTYSFIRSVNSNNKDTSPKGNIGWYNVIQAVHRNGAADGPSYIGQIALGMTTNLGAMFYRTKYNGSWYAWNEVVTTNTGLLRYSRNNVNISSPNCSPIPPSLLEWTIGYPRLYDPEFNEGYNNVYVYNNAQNGVVTVTRVHDTNVGNSSSYIMKVVSAAGAIPNYGGWHVATQTELGKVYTCLFRARIPSGVEIEWNSNSIGTGGQMSWLTNNMGTDKWTWYAVQVYCGSGGSTTFFFSAKSPCTWYLSYVNVIENNRASYAGLRSVYSDYLKENASIVFGRNELQYFNQYTSVTAGATNNANPKTNWYHILRMNHANNSGYFVDLAIPFFDNRIQFRRITNGSDNGWRRVITEEPNHNVLLCDGSGGGSVGIGISSPVQKLDVNGQVKASGFHHSFMDNNNYILLAGGGYNTIFTGVSYNYTDNEHYSLTFHKLSGICNNLVWVDGHVQGSIDKHFSLNDKVCPYIYNNNFSMNSVYVMSASNFISISGADVHVKSDGTYRVGFFYVGKA